MPKSRKQRPSSTPGKQKQSNCHKSQLKNQYVTDPKWYKKDVVGYAKACQHINNQKGNSQSDWVRQVLN